MLRAMTAKLTIDSVDIYAMAPCGREVYLLLFLVLAVSTVTSRYAIVFHMGLWIICPDFVLLDIV
jgi:hypothetical protein